MSNVTLDERDCQLAPNNASSRSDNALISFSIQTVTGAVFKRTGTDEAAGGSVARRERAPLVALANATMDGDTFLGSGRYSRAG